MTTPRTLARTLIVAVLSLLATHVFFFEYRPGVHRVEIPYDLKSFHYPLADYAYQSLREGRIPQWDPSIYSGLPLVANVQAALFYPPSWLLFAASYGRERLGYQTLEDFVFLHVWFAFLVCFGWLRWRGVHALAALAGAAVFALSGHMMTQLQHQGLVAGYTWIPLGLWGIDQAHRERCWQPFWKTAVASALCFAGGFTTFWTVFAGTMLGFALGQDRRWRMIGGTAAALGVSLALAAVQLLPAWEASGLAVKAPRYVGHRDPWFYLSFVLPNYFDFGIDVPVQTSPGFDYFYLGCAGLVGLGVVVWKRLFRAAAAGLAVVGVNLFLLADPLSAVEPLVNSLPVLSQVCRAWYFTGGVVAGIAIVAATGLDVSLRTRKAALENWTCCLGCAAITAWCVRLLWIWTPGGRDFARGWWSAVDAVASIALFMFAAWLFTRSPDRMRPGVAAALLLLVCVEYKAFGTSKRFNARPVPTFVEFAGSPLPSVPPEAIREMRAHPEYRVAIHKSSIFSTELRHARLTTPQGFDPFIPVEYRTMVGPEKFRFEREFELNPNDRPLLALLGVGYFITREGLDGEFPQDFERILPARGYHHVYQWKDAKPAYGWEGVPGEARTIEWVAERRRIAVESPVGGKFRLAEQYFPGWTATVDGAPVLVERCHQALQCVDVPAGKHTIEFRFQSRWLGAGAAISIGTALVLTLLLVQTQGKGFFPGDRTPPPADVPGRKAA